MPTDLEAAWDDLHDATPPWRFVGRPTDIEGRGVWEQYSCDTRERAVAGHRNCEWTAVAPTEPEVIRELRRCLRLIREGQVPE